MATAYSSAVRCRCHRYEILCCSPERARKSVTTLEDISKRIEEPADILVSPSERRQQLDDIHVMSGYLSQHSVIVEQWHDDRLRKQAGVRLVEQCPAGLQGERLGFAELDADHHPLSADLLQQFEVRHDLPQPLKQLAALFSRVFDHTLGFQHVEGRESTGHSQPPLRKGRGMDNTAIQSGKHPLVGLVPQEHGANRNVAAGE